MLRDVTLAQLPKITLAPQNSTRALIQHWLPFCHGRNLCHWSPAVAPAPQNSIGSPKLNLLMALAPHHATSSPKQHWYSSVALATPQNTTSSPKLHPAMARAPQNSTESPKLYSKLAVAPHHSTSSPKQYWLPKTSPAPSTESPEWHRLPTTASASSTGSPKCSGPLKQPPHASLTHLTSTSPPTCMRKEPSGCFSECRNSKSFFLREPEVVRGGTYTPPPTQLLPDPQTCR